MAKKLTLTFVEETADTALLQKKEEVADLIEAAIRDDEQRIHSRVSGFSIQELILIDECLKKARRFS
ncbi:hypothetical protein MSNKSG1_00701 [Marinobacter santoriniensis NKSG1]|uniref:Uncharacterized protein n=1 Tax=Marinobacter santoriniensis NKSG1 TaxID=1288826 RepID=M7CVA0_9GAMM|nr:hypothetical protein [Marinobacter santoriniensis]EMP57481.1 hypothetical protein MSNKSG1_00701 [Marinobacter santoriniensis NKSG1]